MKVLCFDELKPQKGIKFSRQHIHKLVKAGKFPRPIKVGLASNGWLDHELDEWLLQRAKDRDVASEAA